MSGETNGGRAHAYQALRESEELHRAVLSNMSDAVLLTDDDGNFTFICPNVDIIFGYAPDEVRAMSRMGGFLGENLYDRSRLAAEGEVQNIEREVTTKSGIRRSVLIHVKKVAIAGGTVLYACRDVTERKRAEEAARAAREGLERASRLAVAGELLASIVHEITQPLAAASMNAGAGLAALDRQDPSSAAPALRSLLTDIRDECQMASAVIERLRSLVRRQSLTLELLDANEVLNDVRRLLVAEAELRGVTLRFDLEPTSLQVRGDRVTLCQVVANLLTNAMDAVSDRERERLVTLRSRRTPESVEILVSDTGDGVTPEHVPRLFDAFFTTKQKGMGLGLTIARSLVEAQGGAISLAEHEGSGATFRVTLPAHLS